MKNISKYFLTAILCLTMVVVLVACSNNNVVENSQPAAPAETAAPATPAEPAAINWPTQAITITCCYPAGNWTDLSLRVVVARMEQELGQPITVKNVVGADGATAMTELRNSKPDGYTLGGYQHSSLTIGCWLENLPFAIEDFDYFGTCGAYTHGVAVNAKSDIYNLDDLMEYVKNKGSVTVAYSGYVNTFNAMNLFSCIGMADKAICIAYDDGPAQAVANGSVDIAIYAQSGLAAAHDAGQIRIIAALGDIRWKNYPDIPTSVEQGYDVYSIGHQGICAPAGVPEEIKAIIQNAYDVAMSDPDVLQQLQNLGLENNYLNAQEAQDYLLANREIAHDYLINMGLIEK